MYLQLPAFKAFSQSDADEKKVRATIQKMEESFNAHDYSFSGKYDILTPDAYFVNPAGMYWKNRKDIILAVQLFGQIQLKYESVKYTVKNIKF